MANCSNQSANPDPTSLPTLRNFLPTSTNIALTHSLFFQILYYADTGYLDVTEDQ